MRKILFLLLGLSSSLMAMEIHEELDSLNHLVEATQASLENQKQLRHLLVAYQQAHDCYLKDQNNKEAMLALVKTADKLFQSIKENHLTQTFSQDFLNDLSVFSQIAQKRGIPKP